MEPPTAGMIRIVLQGSKFCAGRFYGRGAKVLTLIAYSHPPTLPHGPPPPHTHTQEPQPQVTKLSKKKLRKLNRLTVAQLKQLVERPDVVEMHDVTAQDPKLLIHLKVCVIMCIP